MTTQELLTQTQLIQNELTQVLKKKANTEVAGLARFVGLISLAGGEAVAMVKREPLKDQPMMAAQLAARLLTLGELILQVAGAKE